MVDPAVPADTVPPTDPAVPTANAEARTSEETARPTLPPVVTHGRRYWGGREERSGGEEGVAAAAAFV